MSLEFETCGSHDKVFLCQLCWKIQLAIDVDFALSHCQSLSSTHPGLCGNSACPAGSRLITAAQSGGVARCSGRRLNMCSTCYAYGTPSAFKEHCRLVENSVNCEARSCSSRGTSDSLLPDNSSIAVARYGFKHQRLPLCARCWVGDVDDDTLRSRYFFLDIRLGAYVGVACAMGVTHCSEGRCTKHFCDADAGISYQEPIHLAVGRLTGLCALCWHKTDPIIRKYAAYTHEDLILQGCESARCQERQIEFAANRDRAGTATR
ncbi:hypothetical protein PsYK624_155980 [Phanerochaete sordida]|uniref:Uncharacterized protein n=1 Tax=Phanerochaete sordida TaxID=48140 RepID=A0A9P3GS41_9APHY|nr:hypothetical protein PsYK624_155980 [Phanerochaete sordida]